MTKRLAITIAGAVSLGSYEAGVLFELLAALEAHNLALEKAARDNRPLSGDPITIDVLTGASAGGMTAAIVAQKLLFEADALRDVNKNALHSPWVVDATIESFLRLRPGENPLNAFLSSTAVDEISREYLTKRYGSEGAPGGSSTAPAARRHPAAAAKIHLGLSLSNLNGVGFELPLRPVGDFGYTRHQDDVREFLDPATTDNRDVWERIRTAAVACGAFPFAFRVQELIRDQQAFPPDHLVPFAINPAPMAFTDGGVFQNEPLGLAKKFVDDLDGHINAESRFYLFVSPGGHASASDAQFKASAATLYRTAGQLMHAIIDQAQFHDWIMAEKVNERIAVFNAVAMSLHQALLQGQLGQTSVAPLTEAVIPLMYPTAQPEHVTRLTAARTRLTAQFAPEHAALSGSRGPVVASLWIDSILVLENSAALEKQDEMTIYAITATHAELASTGLHAFQGFFDRSYRQHDYDVGRQKARDLINSINARAGGLGPIHYPDATAPVSIDHSLDGLTFDRVDRQLRRELYDRVRGRLNDMMAAAGLNVLQRVIANNLVLPKLLKKALAL